MPESLTEVRLAIKNNHQLTTTIVINILIRKAMIKYYKTEIKYSAF